MRFNGGGHDFFAISGTLALPNGFVPAGTGVLLDVAGATAAFTLDSKAKDCKEGKLPCPGPCIKLYEGTWKLQDDGKRWCKVKLPGGYWEFSEGHAGQVWEIKDGKAQQIGVCKICGGTTYVDCKNCGGTGKAQCPVCKGEKQVPASGPAKKCPDCDGGKITCTACKGTGLAK